MPDRRRKKQRSCIGQIGKLSLRTCRLVTSRRGSDNQADGADVTEFKVGSTKLHLSYEVGLCSNEAVVYSIPRSPNMKIDLEMVAGLEDRIDGESVSLLNSDMGWQYQMSAYRFALDRMGIDRSMSHKGN